MVALDLHDLLLLQDPGAAFPARRWMASIDNTVAFLTAEFGELGKSRPQRWSSDLRPGPGASSEASPGSLEAVVKRANRAGCRLESSCRGQPGDGTPPCSCHVARAETGSPGPPAWWGLPRWPAQGRLPPEPALDSGTCSGGFRGRALGWVLPHFVTYNNVIYNNNT